MCGCKCVMSYFDPCLCVSLVVDTVPMLHLMESFDPCLCVSLVVDTVPMLHLMESFDPCLCVSSVVDTVPMLHLVESFGLLIFIHIINNCLPICIKLCLTYLTLCKCSYCLQTQEFIFCLNASFLLLSLIVAASNLWHVNPLPYIILKLSF